MADLSPAAQAVLDAYGNELLRPGPLISGRHPLAAALRAAAEQLGYSIVYDDHDEDYIVDVADLLAIAAELEAGQ